jgi:uncharacterized protein YecE (DUF72 family)
MVQTINIGTSGWSYKHWKNDYYPSEVKQKNWLAYYASQFDTTEINSSFYRLPTAPTILQWMETVSEDFVFCPKMSRFLTHMKKLRDPEEPLQRFFGLFDTMQKQIGPVLIQLPSMVAFNYEVANHFFKLLYSLYRPYTFVVEIRHQSWLAEDSMTLMAKYEIGLVISQSENHFPYSEMITAKNIYIRFHGPGALYASSYSDEELAHYAQKCKHWVEEGHIIWAFFNNDIFGYAPRDALRFKTMCSI